MGFDFERSELVLDRPYKMAQNIVDDIRASLKEESDCIPKSLILTIKRKIDSIFNVDIKENHAGEVVSKLFYNPDLEVELEKRIEHYNMVLNVVKTAHYLTDEKINRTVKILEALNADISKELYLAKYVRENYQENQREKALKDAVKTIFPSINNNTILDEIVAKAL